MEERDTIIIMLRSELLYCINQSFLDKTGITVQSIIDCKTKEKNPGYKENVTDFKNGLFTLVKAMGDQYKKVNNLTQ